MVKTQEKSRWFQASDWFEKPAAHDPGQASSSLALGWQAVIALMINILSLAIPIMMLQVYDRIIPHKSFGTLAFMVAGVLTALACDAALRVIRAWLAGRNAASEEHKTSCRAMRHFIHAELTEFEKTGTGTHLQNMNALGRLREFYSGQSLMALVDLPFAFLFLALIGYLSAWLVVVPMALLALFIMTSYFAGAKLRQAVEHRSECEDSKTSYIVSVLSGIHTAKAMGMEAPLLSGFEAQQEVATKSSYLVARANSMTMILSALFGQLSLIVTATVGSLFVLNGELSIGGLTACTILAGRTIQPVQRVLGAWLRMQDLSVSRQQVKSLFSLAQQSGGNEPLIEPRGHVSLQNLSFGYQKNTLLFDNITLDINPGDVIAISGDKSSGKSTLLQLLAGAVTPVSGKVLVDGMAPSRHGMAQLVHHIGYMPQQGTIFQGSILENITGFRDDPASVANAKAAAQILALDEVVNLLPRGYETQLTDGQGDPVPPGVKQRIAIARVLMHQPAIILFDDADRALDKEGYNRLFRLMGRLKGNCTMVIVSHDQNLLSFADRFYHLEQGRLKIRSVNNLNTLSFMPKLIREPVHA